MFLFVIANTVKNNNNNVWLISFQVLATIKLRKRNSQLTNKLIFNSIIFVKRALNLNIILTKIVLEIIFLFI